MIQRLDVEWQVHLYNLYASLYLSCLVFPIRAAMEQHRITCEEEDRYVGKCYFFVVSYLEEWYSESIMVRLML